MNNKHTPHKQRTCAKQQNCETNKRIKNKDNLLHYTKIKALVPSTRPTQLYFLHFTSIFY